MNNVYCEGTANNIKIKEVTRISIKFGDLLIQTLQSKLRDLIRELWQLPRLNNSWIKILKCLYFTYIPMTLTMPRQGVGKF